MGGIAETMVGTIARRHGLSHAALNAMAVVEGHGRPMTAGALGTSMHITTGTMTSVLDTLERRGYVKRLIDPGDRRRVLVDITVEAQAVLDKLLPEIVQATTAVLADFPIEELDSFLVTLARIREAIAGLPDDLGPPIRRRPPRSLRRT